MTRDEAITIVTMIVNGWPGPAWEGARLESYVSQLMALDAELTTRACSQAVKKLRYRPSIAELREFVAIEHRKTADASFEVPELVDMPEWVIRYKRARAVDDYRPFPEQLTAMSVLALQSADHYRVYAPPDAALDDADFWVQPWEYQEGTPVREAL